METASRKAATRMRTRWLKRENRLLRIENPGRYQTKPDHPKCWRPVGCWGREECPAVDRGHPLQLLHHPAADKETFRGPRKSPGPAADTWHPLKHSQYECRLAKEQEEDFVLLSNDVHPSKPKHHLSSAATVNRRASLLLSARVLQIAGTQTQIVWL